MNRKVQMKFVAIKNTKCKDYIRHVDRKRINDKNSSLFIHEDSPDSKNHS